MNIKKGDLIKHIRSMDVAFSVISIYEGTAYLKIKGYWINQGFVESSIIFNTTSNIKLPKSELPNILYCVTPFDKCFRYSEWKSYENK